MAHENTGLLDDLLRGAEEVERFMRERKIKTYARDRGRLVPTVDGPMPVLAIPLGRACRKVHTDAATAERLGLKPTMQPNTVLRLLAKSLPSGE